MGISVAVTRVAANTSTGNQTISTGDLGGLTPKAVMLIATRGVTDGTAADGAGFYWGLSDGTNEATGSYESQHAQTSMDSGTNQDTTANRILTIYDGTSDIGVEATADFVSFGADGVTIDWTDAPAAAYLITAVFYAGTDLTANVGRQDLGSTGDALIANTSVGFEADVLITFYNNTLDGGTLAVGVIHNDRAGAATQRSVGHVQRSTFSSSQVGVHYRDGEGLLRLVPGTQALGFSCLFQTFDSSGWDVQLGGGGNPSSADYAWLALRLGASPVVSAKVYTYSTPTGTGAHTDSNPGFEPQFVMYIANRAAAADTSETDADGGTIGIVMVDADDLYTNSVSDEDAAADSNTQSLSDNILNLPTHTGASGHQATLTSLGSTGPVWNYSATDGTARLWPALAIGVNAGGAFTLTADAGSYGLTGNAASLLWKHSLVASAGSYALTGNAASLLHGYKVTAEAGVYALTGNTIANPRTYVMASAAGSYLLTGNAAALSLAHKIVADAGSYVLTGNAVTFPRTYILVGAAGAYVLTGNTVSLLFNRKLTATAGVYVLTGNNVTLDWSGGLTHYTLAADVGVYTLTGQSASLLFKRVMAALAGSYAVTGNDVGLRYGRKLAASAGSYSFTGSDAGLLYGRKLSALAGSYSLTGNDISLLFKRIFSVDVGVYVLTGNAVTLTHSGAVINAVGLAFLEEVQIYGVFLEEIPHIAQLEETAIYGSQLDEQR